MSQRTITRATLVRIAKKAMVRSGITRAERAKLTEAAKTADEILLHGWRLGKCGCLVGTAYPELFTVSGEWRRSVEGAPFLGPLAAVGTNFDALLDGNVPAAPFRATRVKVIG